MNGVVRWIMFYHTQGQREACGRYRGWKEKTGQFLPIHDNRNPFKYKGYQKCQVQGTDYFSISFIEGSYAQLILEVWFQFVPTDGQGTAPL